MWGDDFVFLCYFGDLTLLSFFFLILFVVMDGVKVIYMNIFVRVHSAMTITRCSTTNEDDIKHSTQKGKQHKEII